MSKEFYQPRRLPPGGLLSLGDADLRYEDQFAPQPFSGVGVSQAPLDMAGQVVGSQYGESPEGAGVGSFDIQAPQLGTHLPAALGVGSSLPPQLQFAGAARDAQRAASADLAGTTPEAAAADLGARPALDNSLTIKDYAALASAAGILGAMFMPKPKGPPRAGGPTRSSAGNPYLKRYV